MASSNCCVLTCIQISQEAGQVVWYSHLFQNFPQFIVIHTVKGFGIVNKAEVDVFLELSRFSMIQQMLAIWCLVPLPFLNPVWTCGISQFTYCWILAWRILSITSVWDREGNGNPLQYSCLENPMDYTVHGILHARILEWEAFPFSRDLPNPGIKLRSPTLQADSLPSEPPGKPISTWC